MIKEHMTRDVVTISSETTVKEAAQAMASAREDILPVVADGKFVGVLSARTIVLEAVAKNRALDLMRVKEIMVPPVVYCYEDQPLQDAIKLIEGEAFRRLFVLDRDNRLVGVLSSAAVFNKKLLAEMHDVDKKRIYPDLSTGAEASG